MTRANQRDTHIRSALETICAELAIIRRSMPITRLRVIQASERTGLTGLLSPALDELDDVSHSVDVINDQVIDALEKLVKG